MENRVGNSNGSGIGKRPRSLDLKTIYEFGESRKSGKKCRKRKSGYGGDCDGDGNGNGEGSFSKNGRKDSVRNGDTVGGQEITVDDVSDSVEMSCGLIVDKEMGLELVKDAESDDLASFPLALNGSVLSVPKRKRSIRCGGDQELKPEEPSSSGMDNLELIDMLNGDDLGTPKDILKGPKKGSGIVREFGSMQLKLRQNANEGDRGIDCLANVDGMKLQASSLKDSKKKDLESSNGSGGRQLHSSQAADEGENTDCNGDALRSKPDCLKVHKKTVDKGSKSGNRHVKSSQMENEEERTPDCLGNGNCSGSKTDTLKVHKKKGRDNVMENRNRQEKSNQKCSEDGKVDRLANGNGSKAGTGSLKVRKKKGLDKVPESGKKKVKPCQKADEESGTTNRLVDGGSSGTQTNLLKVQKKKNRQKGNEVGNMQNSSQDAKEETGRTDFLGASNAEATLKKAPRKHEKAKGLELDRKSLANKARVVDDDCLNKTCNEIDEDDEENLEENAARMLSSRFDPSCTGFSLSSKLTQSPSKNGLLFVSTDGQFTQGIRSSPESESASVDAAGMSMHSRSQDMKGQKRKRRHYYEMSSRNMDPFWMLNRCIKVYWPLDEKWYSGLVDKYDEERKLHHLKYVDRDEEWINLKNERFKLLLLPSEAPSKAERRRAAAKDRTGDERRGNIETLKESEIEELSNGDDSHGCSLRDSEPIISWLARSSHRAKTSSRHATKKRKTSDLTLLSEKARDEILEKDISYISSGGRPNEFGKGKECILDNKSITKDGKVPIVYSRRRFRKMYGVISNPCEGSSVSRVAYEHMSSTSISKLCIAQESGKLVGRSDCLETFWSIDDTGMLKLVLNLPVSVVFKFHVSLPELLVSGSVFAAENYRLMLHTYGTVMKTWPQIHLEMLFVDNTRGLSLFFFKSCLKKALATIHPVLTLFGQPSEDCNFFDLELPVTSIRFKFACVQDHRKHLVFALYNFFNVSCEKWMCLANKLRRHCSEYGQLPLSECTFDTIKALQNLRNGISSIPTSSATHTIEAEPGCSSVGSIRLTGQGGSQQFVMKIPDNKVGLVIGKGGDNIKNMQSQSGAHIQGRKSRHGLALMGASREFSSVCVGHISNLKEMHNNLPLFALSFTAAPTFFLGLHYKLLMEHTVPFIHVQDHDLMEHQESSGMVQSCSRVVFSHRKPSDTTGTEINLDTMSNDVGHSNSISCSEPEFNDSGMKSSHFPVYNNVEKFVGNRCPEKQGPNDIMFTDGGRCSNIELDSQDLSKGILHNDLLTCSQKELEAVGSVVCGEGSPVKSFRFLSTADQVTPEASPSSQNPEKSGANDIVLSESKTCSQIELDRSTIHSRPSLDGDKSHTGSPSSLKNISIEIPAPSQQGSSAIGELHSHNTSVGSICSPNPTAPRSNSLHRNRSGSSFRYSSHGWSDSKADVLLNGFGNRPKKPRTQVSYALPFGDIDFGSKSRSHLQKGLLSKRIRRSSERRSSDVGAGSERNLDSLTCEANVLIIDGDRGWRVYGALVVLELFDHNEWKLAVKVSGVTRYSYKALQFLQPGSTNRYTHAMMWKGGKDWTLEFPDRSQWALFKEMHEECYSRNIRAAMIKNIPIPGVRLLDEIYDKGAEVPFVGNPSKYFCQEKTDVEMALDPCRILYDMDTDDEQWLKEHNCSARESSSSVQISEELFEKIMDMFEKCAYTKQRNQFSSEEAQDLMTGIEPLEIAKIIYNHWQKKRQKKGMPLIRHFQPALWEIYQQQLREWEQTVNKSNYTFLNGHQEKSAPIEKPPMFAFCLKPRGLEVPYKGSKQRSQKKMSVSTHSNLLSGDQDCYHAYGRRLNGFTPGEEKIYYHGHYFDSLDDSPRAFSPREGSIARYYSTLGDGFDVVHSQNLNRSRLKKIVTVMSPKDPRMVPSYGRRMFGMRSGISQPKASFSEWPHHQHFHPEISGSQRFSVKMVDDSELDEFKRREAARRATSMARFKRERAQRLLYRADLLVHKAAVAVMTAEAVKAASGSSVGDAWNN